MITTPEENDIDQARETVLTAADRLTRAYNAEPHAHSDAEIEYSQELLALAARDLHLATEALPRNDRPVGWNTHRRPHQARLDVSLTRDELDELVYALNNSPTDEEDWQAKHNLLERLTQERAAFDRWGDGQP